MYGQLTPELRTLGRTLDDGLGLALFGHGSVSCSLIDAQVILYPAYAVRKACCTQHCLTLSQRVDGAAQRHCAIMDANVDAPSGSVGPPLECFLNIMLDGVGIDLWGGHEEPLTTSRTLAMLPNTLSASATCPHEPPSPRWRWQHPST